MEASTEPMDERSKRITKAPPRMCRMTFWFLFTSAAPAWSGAANQAPPTGEGWVRGEWERERRRSLGVVLRRNHAVNILRNGCDGHFVVVVEVAGAGVVPIHIRRRELDRRIKSDEGSGGGVPTSVLSNIALKQGCLTRGIGVDMKVRLTHSMYYILSSANS